MDIPKKTTVNPRAKTDEKANRFMANDCKNKGEITPAANQATETELKNSDNPFFWADLSFI